MTFCPYCDELIEDEYLYNQLGYASEGEIECPHCGKMMYVVAEMTFNYYIEKMGEEE